MIWPWPGSLVLLCGLSWVDLVAGHAGSLWYFVFSSSIFLANSSNLFATFPSWSFACSLKKVTASSINGSKTALPLGSCVLVSVVSLAARLTASHFRLRLSFRRWRFRCSFASSMLEFSMGRCWQGRWLLWCSCSWWMAGSARTSRSISHIQACNLSIQDPQKSESRTSAATAGCISLWLWVKVMPPPSALASDCSEKMGTLFCTRLAYQRSSIGHQTLHFLWFRAMKGIFPCSHTKVLPLLTCLPIDIANGQFFKRCRLSSPTCFA